MQITDDGKSMTLEELACRICNSYTAEECDDKCPATLFCRRGHNGMFDWLRKVIESGESNG